MTSGRHEDVMTSL